MSLCHLPLASRTFLKVLELKRAEGQRSRPEYLGDLYQTLVEDSSEGEEMALY